MQRKSLFIKFLVVICILSGMMNMTGCSDKDTGVRIEYDRETGIFTVGDLNFDRDVRELSLVGYGITDISALRHCTQLMCLELDDNNISDISALFGMNELTVLSLSNNNVSNISVLRWLPSLHNLSIDNNPISNYSVISKLKNLVALSVDAECARQGYLDKLSNLIELTLCDKPADGAPSTVDISFLTTYPYFYQLNLRHCIAEDFSVINDLAIHSDNSRSIDVTSFILEMTVYDTDDYIGCGLDSIDTMYALFIDCQKGTTLDMVKGMEGVSYIKVGKSFVGYDESEEYRLPQTLTDFSALSTCTSLSHFEAVGLGREFDLSVLNHLPMLETIRLSGDIDDISFVSGLTQLKALRINGMFTDISPVAELKQLERVTLRGDFTDISPVSGLNKLRGISLDGSFSDISVLEGLTALAGASLKSEKLTDISALSGLDNINTLTIKSSPVSDYSPLADMESLTDVYIEYCTIDSLDFITQTESLIRLDIDNCTVNNASALNGATGLGLLSVRGAILNGFDENEFRMNNEKCSFYDE